ncbi:MAG: AGE family epimerase/isomerase [Arachnia sp.]
MTRPGDREYLMSQRADLLRFGSGAVRPQGFGWLDEVGVVDTARPVELWITCRMTHTFALGLLANEPPAKGGPDVAALRRLVDHGIEALDGPLRDTTHGGWFAAVDDSGPVNVAKQCFGHAFVVLAASSAAAAGSPRAIELLAEALTVLESRFWDEDQGLTVDDWDQDWSILDDYRGANANMHTLEAYLAAGDVTGDSRWHERAGRIAGRIAGWARENDWRIPEHFDLAWQPLLEFNHEQPAHPFRPYGAMVGHGFEWARLLLAVDGSPDADAPAGLVEAASELYDRAVIDGWAVDGADGFVYTTDWQGRPVVRDRMHWVVAEAVNTARLLHDSTKNPRYASDGVRWWAYADTCLIDHERGSWHHELDPQNTPAGAMWPGKPDIYHAYQAALLPLLPLVPSFAKALSDAGEDAPR